MSTLIIWRRRWAIPLGRCLGSSAGHGDENGEVGDGQVMGARGSEVSKCSVVGDMAGQWRPARGTHQYCNPYSTSAALSQSLGASVARASTTDQGDIDVICTTTVGEKSIANERLGTQPGEFHLRYFVSDSFREFRAGDILTALIGGEA